MSAKHLDRYLAEFCGRHNRRPMDTEDMMAATVRASSASSHLPGVDGGAGRAGAVGVGDGLGGGR